MNIMLDAWTIFVVVPDFTLRWLCEIWNEYRKWQIELFYLGSAIMHDYWREFTMVTVPVKIDVDGVDIRVQVVIATSTIPWDMTAIYFIEDVHSEAT